MDLLFYFSCALLVATVLAYLVFASKVYLQQKKMNELDKKIAVYGTDEQKQAEKTVFEYRKRVDDFANIIGKHRISSNVFAFLEENTLPNVSFFNFSMSQAGDVNLAGEAEDMPTLSRQFHIFEQNKEYIDKIGNLNSVLGANGKARFTLSITLNPKVFAYQPKAAPEPETKDDSLISQVP